MRALELFLSFTIISTCNSYVDKDSGRKLDTLIQRTFQIDSKKPLLVQKRFSKNRQDVETAKRKAEVVLRARAFEDELNDGDIVSQYKFHTDPAKESYHRDAVLNGLRRRSQVRAKVVLDRQDSSSPSSSSREMQDWKDEWKMQWLQKKYEALKNSSGVDGDRVNMVAARPWGVPCGDPDQHDMPWGTCMLAQECESEYRIYRGDFLCGRTRFICCALELNNYDVNQGFDLSFADSNFDTDSDEQREEARGSKERKKRDRVRRRRKRKRDRNERKRKLRKTIRRIIKEIRKILNRAYNNATSQREKRTKLLKRFIKGLKKQYKNDRISVKNIFELSMLKIDDTLYKKLQEIRLVHEEFMSNDTFRHIVMDRTMSMNGARMLLEAYPDLNNYIKLDKTRRSDALRSSKKKDYLEYDIEYGMLYY